MDANKKWIPRVALFLTGQTITLFGSSLVQFAINWHITLTTKSGLMLTLATLCGFLPQVLISLFAGVWADRFDRKKLIIIADATIAVCTGILAVLFAMGYTDIWLLFVISAIRSLGAGVQTPAVSALLPDLAPQDKLLRVNGINASIQGIMMLLSPAVAGGMYAALGITPMFLVDVATAVVGISLLAILKISPRKAEKSEQHFFKDMLSGVHYVTGTKWLRQFLLFYLLFMLLIGPVVFLSPLMVARSFGDESWRLMVHEMVFSGGTVVGGMLVGILGSKIRNNVRMAIYACCIFAITTAIMGFSPNFIFYLAVMLPMGISMPFINTGSMVVLQTKVESSMMGRVFGLVSIIGSAGMPLSMAIFGPLSDYMSVELQLIITGVLMLAVSLISLMFKDMTLAGKVEKPALADTDSE